MAFFQNFADAVDSYITDSVGFSVIDVVPDDGDAINEGEVCSFRARVNNDGELKMVDVELEIQALNTAQVSTSDTGPWSDAITVDSLTVNAKSSVDTLPLYFKAPSKSGRQTIVSVHITNWDAELTHLLNRHTKEVEKFGHLIADVEDS